MHVDIKNGRRDPRSVASLNMGLKYESLVAQYLRKQGCTVIEPPPQIVDPDVVSLYEDSHDINVDGYKVEVKSRGGEWWSNVDHNHPNIIVYDVDKFSDDNHPDFIIVVCRKTKAMIFLACDDRSFWIKEKVSETPVFKAARRHWESIDALALLFSKKRNQKAARERRMSDSKGESKRDIRTRSKTRSETLRRRRREAVVCDSSEVVTYMGHPITLLNYDGRVYLKVMDLKRALNFTSIDPGASQRTRGIEFWKKHFLHIAQYAGATPASCISIDGLLRLKIGIDQNGLKSKRANLEAFSLWFRNRKSATVETDPAKEDRGKVTHESDLPEGTSQELIDMEGLKKHWAKELIDMEGLIKHWAKLNLHLAKVKESIGSKGAELASLASKIA